jgi:hypothetical protein
VKGFIFFLVVLGGSAAWGYKEYLSPDGRHRRAASTFLQQVRMDETAYSGLMSAYRDERREDRITAAQLECMETISVGDFNDLLSKLLTKKLSRHDLEVATRFYRTPVGDRYQRMIFWALARHIPSLGLNVQGEEPRLYIEDILELEKFRQTMKSRQLEDPMEIAFNLIQEPEMIELELAKRHECLPKSKS